MEKIKQFIKEDIQSDRGKDILTVMIVILVGLASFGLGRLSKNTISSGIKIEYSNTLNNQDANAVSAVNYINSQSSQKITNSSSSKTFFASNRGSKYYSIGCSGGKTIKQENRVYFATGEEAERAGYELSSACK